MSKTEVPPPYPTAATPSVQHVTPLGSLSSTPAKVDCPVCQAPTTTKISKEVGERAYIWGAVLCVLTGCLCWIPCVMDDCKDTHHTCSHCGRPLATVAANGGVKISPSAAAVPSQYERRNETMTAAP
ncbi:unnamed protein product [Aureobasidium uvarum]|uniref:LITAF domain-containing protein n=1 Tax=Aureobasidium uvarum TaxID=2773716 RepID=A0A9N8KGB2_9PEZI|nr:unnamed protein product [Aureobasidium uvarum]